METGPFVRVEERQGCVWVTLDRPPLNLIVPEMVAGLKAAFQTLRTRLVGARARS